MKNGQSLEEQRRALLEQIHASRSTYRDMLSGADKKRAKSARAVTGADRNEAEFDPANFDSGDLDQADFDPDFPRSKTMRWVLDHPYLAAAALVGVAVAVPKLARAGGSVVRRSQEKKQRKAAAQQAEAYRKHSEQYAEQMRASGAAAGSYPPPYPYPPPYYSQPAPSTKASTMAGIAAFSGTAITSLVTIATMLLRDPAKLQAAMRMASQAGDYIGNYRSRRGKQPSAGSTRSAQGTGTTVGSKGDALGGPV